MALDLSQEIIQATTPSQVVNFDKNTPTTGGVVFTPDTPATTDVLYVSSTNASTWIYNGSSYVTYTAPTQTSTTPFYLKGTTIDAQGNKTAAIERPGLIKSSAFAGNGYNLTNINPANVVGLPTIYQADLATTTALPTCVYANGSAGSGATLTASVNGAIANIDSTAVSVGFNILVKDQASTLQNGLYTVTSIGSAGSKWVLTRTANYDSGSRIANSLVFVTQGAVNIKQSFFQAAQNIVVGTTGITYSTNSASVNTSNSIYVSTTGNDSTGTRNDFGKHFLTLEAAVAAASSGDTIYVYPGSYTVTTTATNGIAKDGVNFHFYMGVTITKASSGNLFDSTGFTKPVIITGFGIFNKTTTTGSIANITVNYSIFECYTFSVTNSSGIDINGNYCRVSFIYGVSSGSRCLQVFGSYSNVNFVYAKSTASECIFVQSSGSYSLINGNLAESTATRSVYINTTTGVECNIGYVNGTSDSFNVYASTSVVFNGNASSLYIFGGGFFTFNGYASTIKTSSGINGGARCTNLIINNDYGDSGAVNVTMQGTNLNITQSAGVSNIKLPKSCTYLYVNMTGGVLNFDNTRFEDGYFYGAGYDFVISGGRVNLHNLHAELVDRWYAFKLTGGILDLGSSRIKTTSNNFISFAANIGRQSGIYWSGGTIISNGARIITQSDDCLAIQAVSPGLIMKVLTGGLNTTNITDIRTAKKQKIKCTVTSITSTGITLNDGSGANETFTETNTATYNTTALLASRMVSLINASATLDITATQDTPGTDAYFYLESDFAGISFTASLYSNMSIVLVRPNSNSFTVLCGGPIIQDLNVE